MEFACPRCQTPNPELARFCRHCGLALSHGAGGFRPAGQVRHPDPAPVPADFAPVDEAVDLYFRWEAAWGGNVLLGTETLAVTLFNAGYPLVNVALRVRGADQAGAVVFNLERGLDRLPRGQPSTIEIPSYELPAPARHLAVALASAAFDTEP